MNRQVAPAAQAHFNKYLDFNPKLDWITIEERFQSLAFPARAINELAQRISGYLRDKNIHTWEEFQQHLPQGRTDSGALHLDEAYIRKTLQRTVVQKHLKNILQDYQLNRVVNICWFLDEENRKVIWDGQHTALALFFIARYVFHLQDLHIVVPNTSFIFTTPDARDAYISNGSGEGKEWISTFEMIRQQFMAAEYATQHNIVIENPKHERAHTRLWKMLNNGLYLTPLAGEERFRYQEDGMFGRTPEFQDQSPDVVLDNLITWYKMGPERPLIHWNAIVMYEYFRLLHQQNNRGLTHKEIQQVASFTKHWQHDFDNKVDGWWDVAKKVYANYHRRVIYPVTKKAPLLKASADVFLAIFFGYLQHKGAPLELYVEHYDDMLLEKRDYQNV